MTEAPHFTPLVAPEREGGPSLWFAFVARKLVLVRGEVPAEAPVAAEGEGARRLYLGTWGDAHVHALGVPASTELPAEASVHDLREALGRLSPSMGALAGRASQLLEWDRTHRFCGACGAATEPSTTTRSRACPTCRLSQFPRVAPAMIVAIERGDEILMARTPSFPPGIHSLVAGFVDAGESLEEAVAREVREEVGLRIRNLRYFGSQPWPFPHSLMLGFQAEYDGGEVTPAPGEIEAAAFYRFDAMPPMFPGRVSISQWLIADYLRRHGVEPLSSGAPRPPR